MTSVLIIDDCEDFRDSIREILIDAGYSVEVADGADSAFDYCEHTSFDVFLCDLVLPDPDDEFSDTETQVPSAMVGVHTMRELVKRYPGVPVVAVSGELTGGSLAGLESFGVVRCLSKPFGREELLNAVAGVLALE